MEISLQVDCHMELHEERVWLWSSIRRWVNNYHRAAGRPGLGAMTGGCPTEETSARAIQGSHPTITGQCLHVLGACKDIYLVSFYLKINSDTIHQLCSSLSDRIKWTLYTVHSQGSLTTTC